MTVELNYLALVTVLTALIRIPWMLNKVAVRGLSVVSRYPRDPEPLSGWAHRIWVAHEDAVDNLVVFGILVVVLHLAGHSNTITVVAATTFFWARVVHLVAYAFAVPWVKTAAHLVSFAAVLALSWEVVLLAM